MSWLEQVWHVAAKDVRQARWGLVAYVTLVVLATAQAAALLPATLASLSSMSFFVPLTAAFLVAVVTQADSPTRVDAFWTTHPLRPLAILGAKMVIALLLVTIAGVGQLIAVRSFGVSAGELWPLVIGGMIVLTVYLLAAMVLSSLVRDLRSFALAIAGAFVAIFTSGLILGVFYRVSSDFVIGLPLGLEVQGDLLAAVVSLTFLVWLYRRRDVRIGVRVAGFAIAAFVAMAAGSGPSHAEPVAKTPAAANHLASLSLLGDRVQVRGHTVNLYVSGSSLSRHERLVLRGAMVELHLRTGDIIRVPIEQSLVDFSSHDAAVPRDTSLRWIEPDADTLLPTLAYLRARLTNEQRSAVEAGIERVVLDGQLIVAESLPVATLPLSVGASYRGGGRQVRVAEWTFALREPTLELSMIAMPDREILGDDDSWISGSRFQAALVNRSRGEALSLSSGGSSGGIGGLVLPGVPVVRRTMQYSRNWWNQGDPERQGVPLVDEAWFRDAEVLVMEQVVRAVQPIRLETAVQQPRS